jgi:hypothetical protein
MSKIKITAENNIQFEAEGEDRFVQEERRAFIEMLANKNTVKAVKAVQEAITPRTVRPDGLAEETVVIYDDYGIPSIMRKISKVTDAELFGGANKTHPAFIIDGEEYDEIYISVYPNCVINGRPYSLPYMKPWTDLTNDEAAKACFSKGDGWHLMTAAEWGLVANICNRDGTYPHGNTKNGKYHADPSEEGATFDGGAGKTLTGSGPATWTHNHKPDGIHDLCGNVWEMIRGLRIINGKIEVAKDNNAALDIDLTEVGDDWQPLTAPNGKPINFSVGDDFKFTTDEPEDGYNGTEWENVYSDFGFSDELKELALYPGEDNAYLYVDSTEGEYLPYRGGYWSNGTIAGVFCAYLLGGRTGTSDSIGFRSAYFKKKD